MSTTEAQTYWKQIKVPADLMAAGWQLERHEDEPAPFRMRNAQLALTTDGFHDPIEAIQSARQLSGTSEPAARTTGNKSRRRKGGLPKLPVALLDEGWRLGFVRDENAHYATRDGGPTTENYATPAEAVAAAIELEANRQRELEAREGLDQAAARAASEPGTIFLPLVRLRTDGGTQQRLEFDQDVLRDYVAIMRGGVKFPAVEAVFDGEDYWLFDGFYRRAAAVELGHAEIEVKVYHGSQREARLRSLGANATHGQPRTQADKRAVVVVMLQDPEWATWSDNVIAGRVGVSQPFVSKLRRELGGDGPTVRRGKDDRVIETAKIGTRSGTEDDPRQMGIGEIEGAIETELDHEEKAPKLCATCKRELSAKDFCNAEGDCWNCAKPKKTAKKLEPASPKETSKSDGPTLENLRRKRPLTIQFAWIRGSQPAKVIISGRTSQTRYLSPAELPAFPAKVLDAIAEVLDQPKAKLPARKGAVKTGPRKTRVVTPTKKRGTKKNGKRTKRATTASRAPGRAASGATKRGNKRQPGRGSRASGATKRGKRK
jgi:hypothetical protein